VALITGVALLAVLLSEPMCEQVKQPTAAATASCPESQPRVSLRRRTIRTLSRAARAPIQRSPEYPAEAPSSTALPEGRTRAAPRRS
jgi:hypothetical protein